MAEPVAAWAVTSEREMMGGGLPVWIQGSYSLVNA